MARSNKDSIRVHGVRDQYEVYPYPNRDPEDDRTRLMQTLGGNLDGINHFVFGGRRDFSTPFRVLVAGGGTGDAVIYLAQQLADRGCPGELVYLDLSVASRRIAERRAEIRGLAITFLTGSLTEVASLAPGPYDYIDCSGVLHHLPDPDAGLAALAGVLAPDGGMGIMLYGTLGRSGVYSMQDMLRTMAPPSLPAAERVAICRRAMAALPASNLLKRNAVLGVSPSSEDNELFDMFLHSQDRSYTVGEIARMAEGAGLRPAAFIPTAVYEPASFCADAELLRPLKDKSAVERAAVAEALSCAVAKHVVYLVPAGGGPAPPGPDDDDAIPVWHDRFSFPAHDVNGTYRFGKSRGPVLCQITITPAIAAIATLINGATPLGEIRRRSALSPGDFATAMRVLWALHGLHYLFLKAPQSAPGAAEVSPPPPPRPASGRTGKGRGRARAVPRPAGN